MNIFGRSKHTGQGDNQRVSLDSRTAFTLPPSVRGIRVITGKAWVALDREDVIVGTQETLYLHPDRHGTVITALGQKRLEFEIIGKQNKN